MKALFYIIRIIFIGLFLTYTSMLYAESWTRSDGKFYYMPKFQPLKSYHIGSVKVKILGKNPYTSIGIFFKSGDFYPQDSVLTAKNIAGKFINVQCNPQNFYPNGSVRFAVITFEKPKNSASEFEVLLSSTKLINIHNSFKQALPNVRIQITAHHGHKNINKIIHLKNMQTPKNAWMQGHLMHNQRYQTDILDTVKLIADVTQFANNMTKLNIFLKPLHLKNKDKYTIKIFHQNQLIKTSHLTNQPTSVRIGYATDNLAALNAEYLMQIGVFPRFDTISGVLQSDIHKVYPRDNLANNISLWDRITIMPSWAVEYLLTAHQKAYKKMLHYAYSAPQNGYTFFQPSLYFLPYIVATQRYFYDKMIEQYQHTKPLYRMNLAAQMALIIPAQSSLKKQLDQDMQQDVAQLRNTPLKNMALSSQSPLNYLALILSFSAASDVYKPTKGLSFLQKSDFTQNIMDRLLKQKRFSRQTWMMAHYVRAFLAMRFNINQDITALEHYGQLAGYLAHYTMKQKNINTVLPFKIVPKTAHGFFSDDNILTNNLQGNTLQASRGHSILYGTKEADIMTLKQYSGIIFSGAGNDILYAGDYNSYLFGGDGADTLYSSSKNDYMKGDNEKQSPDIFVFSQKNFGEDIIVDFTPNIDKIKMTPDTGIYSFYHENKLYGLRRDVKDSPNAYRKVIDPDTPSNLSKLERRKIVNDLLIAASRGDIKAKNALKEVSQVNFGIQNYLRSDGEGGTYINFNLGRTPEEKKKMKNAHLYDYYGIIHLKNVPMDALRSSDFIFSN